MQNSVATKSRVGAGEILRFRYLGRHDIEDLAELWRSQHRRHTALAPHLEDVITSVGVDESWRRRRAQYLDWLADPDTIAVLAERGGVPVGYAMVTVRRAHQGSWERGERVAVVQTLSVRPDAEDAQVGPALLEEVQHQLAAVGIRELELDAVATNADAIRFYEEQGFRPFVTTLVARIGMAGPHD
ncbi:GNAT family N-acetyltransferase [Marinitenerispora sediminis]|uniref:GNAT family N-acetyltransferase n=1 Tax=Marinitenerispora sediminis TaxID=1931232 RepID=A0A368T8K8_9ACTN|nr:GNAT family N-acetyltransferase [Marinitenerispora sediminis]RCV56529.1 GNAT family N-acetyltransferase [Marinitenerispora sediminis]RCV60120.1 GNAT family N-acetyltransferase [Marinitenerispora sediminis]RCV60373.1 GNAT family N-acetyltransferase [Marinitenerispora sediminis]